ncbi:MAG TPA: hypothetical protein VLT33_23175, partial [Labilithrix sp.]|nr:hypothetical protein [Labilithrix sp.]
YERALALGWSARGATGLGWTLLRLGEPAPAVALFERAAADRQENEAARPRRAYLDALRGLAAAHGALRACDETVAVGKRLFAEAPEAPPLEVAPCPPLAR